MKGLSLLIAVDDAKFFLDQAMHGQIFCFKVSLHQGGVRQFTLDLLEPAFQERMLASDRLPFTVYTQRRPET